MESLDPQQAANYFGGQIAMRPVYDSLLRLTRDDAGRVGLAPQLATGWEVASDGLSITFHLRTGVKFQDGTTFDAEAVKANLDRALGPESTVSSLLPSVKAVEAVGQNDVVLQLSKPDASAVWAMGINTTGMMASPAAFATLDSEPIGAGPYKLVSKTDTEIVYERWDGYWNSESVLSKKLVISTVADVNARYNGLRSGQYDIAFLASPLDAEAKSLEDTGYQWRQSLGPIATSVLLNPGMKPFDDVRVRRAVSMAVNRTKISENLLNGLNPPAYQTFLEGYIGHDPSLDRDPYDPDAARQLVKEAGADGASVEILYPASAPYDAIAAVVQQALGDIGLKVKLVPKDNAFRPTWREGGVQAAVTTTSGSADPASTMIGSYLGGDNVAVPPAELVRMAEAANALPLGSEGQNAAYQEVSQYLVANPIHIPLVQFGAVFLSSPKVIGDDTLSLIGAVDLDFSKAGVAR